MADQPDDEESSPWKPVGRQLGPDGRITGEVPRGPSLEPVAAPAPNPRRLPKLDALTTGELELDTARSGRLPYVEPGAYRPIVAPTRRGPLKWVLVLLALGLAAVAAFLLVPGLQRKLALPGGKPGTLVIYSEPSGATVKLGGKVIGNTPWASDNLWGGEVKYELSAPGYKPSRGTFQGGAEVKLNLKLKKK